MGVITLEDIMESILQGRVYDEWDMKGSLENRNEMRCDFEFNSNLDAHKTFFAGVQFSKIEIVLLEPCNDGLLLNYKTLYVVDVNRVQ
jgi:Mg2+/Co2+ transporter CorC